MGKVKRPGPDFSGTPWQECACGGRHKLKPQLPHRRCAIHQEILPCVEWGGPLAHQDWLCWFHRMQHLNGPMAEPQDEATPTVKSVKSIKPATQQLSLLGEE